MLQILIDKPQTGLLNMQKDALLFQKAEKGKLEPTLRIYKWQQQCITLGYSQKPEQLLNLAECQKQGWEITSRITGGGLVFHNTHEITYSLFLPKNLQQLPAGIIPSCNYISEFLINTLHKIGIAEAALASNTNLGNNRGAAICFNRPTKYEIVVGNKKIIGSAQKQGKKTLMQQGSICIKKNNPAVLNCLKEPAEDNSIGILEIIKDFDENKFVELLNNSFAKVFN